MSASGSEADEAIRRASPETIRGYDFPAGSMGPKVQAACRFVELTGKPAAIGALKDLPSILRGEAGTTVAAHVPEIVFGS
jgi:carbamate kinase